MSQYCMICGSPAPCETHTFHGVSGPARLVHPAPLLASNETLGVESHFGALWVCAIRGADSTPLAKIGTPEQADRFRAALNLMLRAAHERGALGI